MADRPKLKLLRSQAEKLKYKQRHITRTAEAIERACQNRAPELLPVISTRGLFDRYKDKERFEDGEFELFELADESERLVRARANARELARCANPDNQSVVYDLHAHTEPEDLRAEADRLQAEEDGYITPRLEFYDGHMPLACCGRFLCPHHQARKRRKARKRALKAMRSYTLQQGEWIGMLTLTHTTLLGVRIGACVDLNNRAFRRWQRGEWYKANIRGGIKVIEWTVPKAKARTSDAFAYHTHLHLAAVIKVEFSTPKDQRNFEEGMRESWTKAFCKELEHTNKKRAKRGMRLYPVPEIKTNEGTFLGKVSELFAKTPDGDPLEQGLNEVVKYITKLDIAEDLTDRELIDVAGQKRWPRQVETFGCVRESDQAARLAKQREAAEPLAKLREQRGVFAPLLDTEVLSVQISPFRVLEAEEAESLWKARKEARERAIALAGLPQEYENTFAGQGWEITVATILCELEREGDFDEVTGLALAGTGQDGRDWRGVLGRVIRETRAKERLRGACEVTKGIVRREVLGEFMRAYLARGKPDESRIERDMWLSDAEYEKNMRSAMGAAQSFARYRLARRYPYAHFCLLNGEEFKGVIRERSERMANEERASQEVNAERQKAPLAVAA